MSIRDKKILFAFIFCLLWISAEAAKGPIMLNVHIPSGVWKTLRLKNLPKDAVVALEVKSDGEITVILVDTSDYLRFPNIHRPLFLGKVEKNLSFSVSIPKSGHYYVVLDNRLGQRQREVTVIAGAERGKSDQINEANKILREFQRQFHQLFVFNTFPIGVERCDKPKAFGDESGIILCTHYVQQLYDILGNVQESKDALTFSIFHELGRILLTQWDHPLSEKRATADQFATVLMIMLNKTESLLATAENFAQNPSISEALMKVLRNDHHPLTVQRARKILAWLKDSQFVLEWQKFLVPHMQTILLKKLQEHPTPWTDLPLVEKELAVRLKKLTSHELHKSLFRESIAFYAIPTK